MAVLREWVARLWGTLRPSRRDADLEQELRLHLELAAEHERRRGQSPEDAERAAVILSGGLAQGMEAVRDQRGLPWLNDLSRDLRYGLRLLVRHRLFAGFAVASLALGIGGTTAVFSLYDTIVLRDLPVRAPDRLVTLALQRRGVDRTNAFLPYPQFEGMRDGSQSVEGLFARTTTTVALSSGGTTAIASALSVTGSYYQTLGLAPAAGRLLTPEDNRFGHAVVVLSHGYWQRRFGGDPSVVGQTVSLNRVPFVVLGVEPKGFFGVVIGSPPDVTIPMLALGPVRRNAPAFQNAFGTWIEVMGRLRPGVSIEQAREELDTIFRQVGLAAAADAAPDSDSGRFVRETHVVLGPAAKGGVSGLRNRYAQDLRLLLMLVVGVLALASLNVAALLLSRSESRRKEIALRFALGAGRWRIVRQLVTESALIGAFGGLLGLVIAWRGSETLLRLATSRQALPLDVSPDLRILAFAGGVSFTSCLLFGVLPAIRVTSSSRGSWRSEIGGPRRRWLDRALVVSQTALALVLAVTAGLFLRSLQTLWAQDTGYDRHDVLMFSLDANLIGTRRTELAQTYQRVLDGLRSIPTARAVTLATVRQVDDAAYLVDGVTAINGQPINGQPQRIRVALNHLGPGYFETMGIRLRAGREFDSRDRPDTPKVAIVSEELARQFTGSPIGQSIEIGRGNGFEIIGVAADNRYANVKDAPRGVVYLSYFQITPAYPLTFSIKYAGNPAQVLRAAGEAVTRVDPELALFRAKTLEVQTQESFARERMLALTSTYFGGFAWLLAAIGLYGLMACTVSDRTREFGLRMALGAQSTTIRWNVVRESAVTVALGLVLGFGGALAVAQAVRTQLFGVKPTDPTALMAAVAALLFVACCASFLPVRRASRIEPTTALRQE